MSEVPIEGKIVGQIGEATYYEVRAEDEAQAQARLYQRELGTMTFYRETPESRQVEMESLYRNLMLGRGWPPYECTPQQELKDRLNAWARGIYPGLPINWKGLS